jgi:hypothetical protein
MAKRSWPTYALALVAARRRDDAGDAGFAALQLVHVDEPAADLEGTDGRVVFVLTQISAPTRCESSGQRICGVGGTTERMRSAAASIAASSGSVIVAAATPSGIHIQQWIAIDADHKEANGRWIAPVDLTRSLPGAASLLRSQHLAEALGRIATVFRGLGFGERAAQCQAVRPVHCSHPLWPPFPV